MIKSADIFAGHRFLNLDLLKKFKANMGREKDLKDVEGDRLSNIPTLPVMLGEARARTIIAGLVFLSYLIVPLFFYLVFFSHTFMVISIGFGIANFIYIRNQYAQERVIFFMYFAYAILLILFFNVLR